MLRRYRGCFASHARQRRGACGEPKEHLQADRSDVGCRSPVHAGLETSSSRRERPGISVGRARPPESLLRAETEALWCARDQLEGRGGPAKAIRTSGGCMSIGPRGARTATGESEFRRRVGPFLRVLRRSLVGHEDVDCLSTSIRERINGNIERLVEGDLNGNSHTIKLPTSSSGAGRSGFRTASASLTFNPRKPSPPPTTGPIQNKTASARPSCLDCPPPPPPPAPSGSGGGSRPGPRRRTGRRTRRPP